MQHLDGSLHAVMSLRSFIMEIMFVNGVVWTGQLSVDGVVAKNGDLEHNLLVFC